MAKADVRTKIKPNLKLSEPSLFKVMYINDDVTTMEFVVSSLIKYFDYTEDTAHTITEDIHSKGSATVAILPFEIAEQKGTEVTMAARTLGYPLRIKIESKD
jgi:ATP-dependent Clp protease adaptor protein ClpS